MTPEYDVETREYIAESLHAHPQIKDAESPKPECCDTENGVALNTLPDDRASRSCRLLASAARVPCLLLLTGSIVFLIIFTTIPAARNRLLTSGGATFLGLTSSETNVTAASESGEHVDYRLGDVVLFYGPFLRGAANIPEGLPFERYQSVFPGSLASCVIMNYKSHRDNPALAAALWTPSAAPAVTEHMKIQERDAVTEHMETQERDYPGYAGAMHLLADCIYAKSRLNHALLKPFSSQEALDIRKAVRAPRQVVHAEKRDQRDDQKNPERQSPAKRLKNKTMAIHIRTGDVINRAAQKYGYPADQWLDEPTPYGSGEDVGTSNISRCHGTQQPL